VLLVVRMALPIRTRAREAQRRAIRALTARAEAERLISIRTETVASAVDLTTAVARFGQETVAGMSFRLLDAAAGRRRSRRARRAIADTASAAGLDLAGLTPDTEPEPDPETPATPEEAGA